MIQGTKICWDSFGSERAQNVLMHRTRKFDVGFWHEPNQPGIARLTKSEWLAEKVISALDLIDCRRLVEQCGKLGEVWRNTLLVRIEKKDPVVFGKSQGLISSLSKILNDG